jgi:DNA polymerase III subunit delta'
VSAVVDETGQLVLPWLRAPLTRALAAQRGHALLLHAAPGIGALEFALGLAQSWLCDTPAADGIACGRCASCRALHGHVHPDLFVLMSERERRATGWLLADDKADDDGKRKPSRQIRIDEVRAAIDWVGKTAGRGRGKAWLLHPVEALNEHSASALLKIAEEPPAGTRLVLTCSDPLAILPTVRSRCHRVVLPAPARDTALAWLAGQGLARPEVLLDACGGRPLDALALARDGVDAAAWQALPRALAEGRPGALAGWPVARALDALFKLAHDALARAAGTPTRYFAAEAVPIPGSVGALARWVRELQRLARHAEHPWHEGLMADALVARAHAALAPKASRSGRESFVTLDA